MKTIKLILFGVLTLFIASCEDHTCTSFYDASIKIDGDKERTVSIKYIGPSKYEKRFNSNLEEKTPCFKGFSVTCECDSKDFKKNNYNFLEITNTSSTNVYICAIISGHETSTKAKTYNERLKLFRIYDKQDKDPNYDYKKDPLYKDKDIEYLSREDLYKKLFEEKYPYIIKLAPKKTCIIKWGGFGIQVLK